MKKIDKTCSGILDFIRGQDNFIITTHLSADGDAYGAALSVAFLLNQLGKSYDIVLHDQEKQIKYKYMWGWEDVLHYSENWPKTYDAGIVVDVPSQTRIGDPASLLPAPANCVKIDHHPIEENFSDYNLVETAASSTCQLIYEIIVRSGIEFNYDVANLLLSGIMYDTGRFSFSNTNKRDFEIAAHLLSYDVNPNLVASHLFFNNDFESMKTIGYGLANMKSPLNGKVCLIYLPLDIMQRAEKLDIEELANYSLAVEDVEVGLFIRQPEPDFIKVSFRSKGLVDVNKVARSFGGGGHVHAAGCRVRGNPEELMQQIINKINDQLKEPVAS